MGVWPVKAPDLSWADWRYALEECVAAGDRDAATRRLEARWSHADDALACLSVRSTFDLLLRASAWEPGDAVVFTALTVPDMPRIARLHGLRTVPLDIDPATTEPDPDRLAALAGPRTRAVVHAHLFGGRADVSALADAAHHHGLLFVEDCAQCYAGPGWTGHEASDVTLFSFGPWKTATALGGAMARVRKAGLRERMRALSLDDPIQAGGDYLTTVLAHGALKAASTPDGFGLFVEACRTFGLDHRTAVHRLTKGYQGARFETRIRRRPAAPLLAVLERRLDEGDRPVRRRERPARVLLEALGVGMRRAPPASSTPGPPPPSGSSGATEGRPVPDAPTPPSPAEAVAPGGTRGRVVVPGSGLARHGWWMIPVLAEADTAGFMAELLDEGFDTTRGRLRVVAGGDGGAGDTAAAPGASRLVGASVYLPFDPGMPESELRRLGRAARGALGLGAVAGRP